MPNEDQHRRLHDVIANDPYLIGGHVFRPTFLSVFSILDSDIGKSTGSSPDKTDLSLTIFIVGNHKPPKETWTLNFSDTVLTATQITSFQEREKVSRIVKGRFTLFNVTFELATDKFISGIKSNSILSISCNEFPESTWYFSSADFSEDLLSVRKQNISDGAPAFNFYVYSSQLDFVKLQYND